MDVEKERTERGTFVLSAFAPLLTLVLGHQPFMSLFLCGGVLVPFPFYFDRVLPLRKVFCIPLLDLFSLNVTENRVCACVQRYSHAVKRRLDSFTKGSSDAAMQVGTTE